MNNACVIGFGMVGQATSKSLNIEKHFDLQDDRCNITLNDAAKCEYVFICLPTPVKDGQYQVDDLINTVKQIESINPGRIYIIRSTVFPGFSRHLMELVGTDRIISNPEFLTESTWENDSTHPPFILLGGPQGVTFNQVKAIYQGRFKYAPIIETDNITAEMAKLSLNGYFATKVIFANQIYDSCQKLGVNYETVKKVMESNPFGPKNHFTVWFRGKRGVHGKCLPKDSQALAYYGNSELVKKVVELNELYINQHE